MRGRVRQAVCRGRWRMEGFMNDAIVSCGCHFSRGRSECPVYGVLIWASGFEARQKSTDGRLVYSGARRVRPCPQHRRRIAWWCTRYTPAQEEATRSEMELRYNRPSQCVERFLTREIKSRREWSYDRLGGSSTLSRSRKQVASRLCFFACEGNEAGQAMRYLAYAVSPERMAQAS
jgi:hypothetical protein